MCKCYYHEPLALLVILNKLAIGHGCCFISVVIVFSLIPVWVAVTRYRLAVSSFVLLLVPLLSSISLFKPGKRKCSREVKGGVLAANCVPEVSFAATSDGTLLSSSVVSEDALDFEDVYLFKY
ncbi:uncharacterized protein G2W53_005177 [Senna tora]|uniref:Uncharacterized protein n=1 Tax=Senna tora TaxID=362788 RepID=A0A835CHV2_9FABA|nr:uncharacterized protein G2W53_005177 [Senna tora]